MKKFVIALLCLFLSFYSYGEELRCPEVTKGFDQNRWSGENIYELLENIPVGAVLWIPLNDDYTKGTIACTYVHSIRGAPYPILHSKFLVRRPGDNIWRPLRPEDKYLRCMDWDSGSVDGCKFYPVDYP